MRQPNSKSKSSMHRGAKLFLASLSVAATLSGWAWLTQSELLEATQSEPIQSVETFDLANLPVRGLRQVGDALAVSSAVAQSSNQVQAQGERTKPIRKTRSSK